MFDKFVDKFVHSVVVAVLSKSRTLGEGRLEARAYITCRRTKDLLTFAG